MCKSSDSHISPLLNDFSPIICQRQSEFIGQFLEFKIGRNNMLDSEDHTIFSLCVPVICPFYRVQVCCVNNNLTKRPLIRVFLVCVLFGCPLNKVIKVCIVVLCHDCSIILSLNCLWNSFHYPFLVPTSVIVQCWAVWRLFWSCLYRNPVVVILDNFPLLTQAIL